MNHIFTLRFVEENGYFPVKETGVYYEVECKISD